MKVLVKSCSLWILVFSGLVLINSLTGCGGGSASSAPSNSGPPPVVAPSQDKGVSIGAAGLTRSVPLMITLPNSSPASSSTPISQAWPLNSVITLDAPDIFGDRAFDKWTSNGSQLATTTHLQLTITDPHEDITAVYHPRPVTADGFLPNYVHEIDPQTGKVNQLYHWAIFPVKVAFISNSGLTADRENEAVNGFDQWVKVTNQFISYQLVSDPSEADITVAFIAQGNNGRGGSTGYTADDNRNLQHADIVLNLTYLSQLSNVMPIAMHEFGHALGIAGHSNTSSDIMSVLSNIYTLKQPSQRDINMLLTGYTSSYGRSVPGHGAQKSTLSGP